ncbi:outer membrane beta-barrel protein [Helicobacter sp. T3_23-1059]
MKSVSRCFLLAFLLGGGGNIYADELESSLAKEADSKVAVFVGGEVGYGVAFLSATNNSAKGKTTELRAPYGVVGGKIGIKKLFGEKQIIGLRGYVSYHYSNDGEYSSHQTAFNTEAVFNIGKRVGIYAGLGAGYASNVAISSNNFANGDTNAPKNQTTLINDPKGSGFILPVNVGFEVALNAHHFVNFNVRAPSIAASERLGKEAESSTTYSARNLLLTLGYTYQF